MTHLAVVFPGQGSQSVGMGQDIANAFPLVNETFEEASEYLGYDIESLISDGPQDTLNQTEYTQPALLTVSYAFWRVLTQQVVLKPHFFAGHSLGEYTALLAAGVITFEQAVRLVSLRGKLMQQCVESTAGCAMAAILGASDEQVEEACTKACNEIYQVYPANYNAPGQVVIAGHVEAVAAAIDIAKSLGAKRGVILPVSVPSHCMLMANAADELSNAIQALSLQPPCVPVVQNADAKPASSLADLQAGLVRQLTSPVQWTKTVGYLAENNVSSLIECGPGKVLFNLNKRIAKSITHYAVCDQANLESTVANIQEHLMLSE